MYGIWISFYPIILQYMGLLNIIITYYNIWDYGSGFINVTERNHWMILNTAFIHT